MPGLRPDIRFSRKRFGVYSGTLRAHSSPHHPCTLHRVLFLHYLRNGAAARCRATLRAIASANEVINPRVDLQDTG